MSDSLYVGIDVSSRKNSFCILSPDGKKLDSYTVTNSNSGTNELSNRIIASMFKSNISSVKIGLEATSIYGTGLVNNLKQDQSLNRVTNKIYLLNPNQVNKFKKERYTTIFQKLITLMHGLLLILLEAVSVIVRRHIWTNDIRLYNN